MTKAKVTLLARTEGRVKRTVKPPEHLINDFETDLDPLETESKPIKKNISKHSKRSKISKRQENYSDSDKNKLWECNICGNELSSKHNLESHISSIHEGKKPFQCSICKKNFTQKGSLQVHMTNVHSENKEEFRCNICNINYSSKRVLKEHIEYVHETDNPFKCTQCKSSFTIKGRLTEHIRTVHEGRETIYKCFHCEATFFHESSMKTHFQKAHEESNCEKDDPSVNCSLCKEDVLLTNLENHVFNIHGLILKSRIVNTN